MNFKKTIKIILAFLFVLLFSGLLLLLLLYLATPDVAGFKN